MKYFLRCLLLLPLRPAPFKALLWLLRSVRMLPPKVTNPVNPPQHLLVINLTHFVGDTVMMMPLLDRLQAALPSAIIDVATSASMSTYVREIPYLGKVVRLQTDKKRIPIWSQYRNLVHMIRLVRSELFARSYDLCLLPRWGTDPEMSPFLASMTSASRIIGHDPSEEVDTKDPFPGASQLFDRVSHGGKGLPEAIRELRLIESFGLVDYLDLTAEEFRSVAALSRIAGQIATQNLKTRLGITDTEYMVLAPGASTPAKRWPPERFAEVARGFQESLGFQILIIGGSTESLIGKQIENQLGTSCVNLIGRTTLPETTALLAGAAFILTNDSGPAHIGAGLGIHTLVLTPCPLTCTREVLSSPLRFRPVGPAVRVLQPPHPAPGCGERCNMPAAHCILGITVDEVRRSAEQLLGFSVQSCCQG